MPDDLEDYRDEAYFDRRRRKRLVFDSNLLRESALLLRARKPMVFGPQHSVTESIRAMQGEHRGCVLITADGTPGTRVTGIFTERDVLFRVVDRGRNPAVLPLAEVMTADPECLSDDQSVAAVLNKMSVGGFRHIPIVDSEGRPLFVASVRDVVEFLVEAFPREILNQPVDLVTKSQRQREGA